MSGASGEKLVLNSKISLGDILFEVPDRGLLISPQEIDAPSQLKVGGCFDAQIDLFLTSEASVQFSCEISVEPRKTHFNGKTTPPRFLFFLETNLGSGDVDESLITVVLDPQTKITCGIKDVFQKALKSIVK